MKKILLRLCVIMSLFTICMFGNTTANATSTTTTQQATFDEATVKQYAESYFTNLMQFDFSILDDEVEAQIYKDNLGTEKYATYEAWKEVMDQAGKYKKTISTKVDMKKTSATATIKAKCEKKNIRFVIKFDSNLQTTLPELAIDSGTSDKPDVGKAGLNTLMGMGTVFVVLIFISFLISLFKYIPNLFNRSKKQQEVTAAKEETAAPVVEDEEELADDGELVAVITAAIMASMGDEVPADGLVVRSIRKVNKSKWKNA